MTTVLSTDPAALRTIFSECRQCGTCCKSYRKIALQPDEVDFIRKIGGHVGVDISLAQLRESSLDVLMEQHETAGKVYMIHPDDTGCVFLQRKNETFYCRIYHHRPRTCQGFRCNMVDSSFLELFGGADSIHLLGQNRFGLPL